MYDPIEIRLKVFRHEMLKFYLGTQYNPDRPMGNVACSELAYVIESWLVGLHVETKPMIGRSLDWIKKALDRNEKFGGEGQYLTILHWGLAIGEWLESGRNVEVEWNAARIYEEAWWRSEVRPWPTSEIIRYGLDDYMAFACQCGEQSEGVEAGIKMYEHFTGKSKPPSLSKLLKPRDYGYALCLHQSARQNYEAVDLLNAGRKMLQANLQETWLGSAQNIRAATWLKIVYGYDSESATPLQTILRAYENMPKVKRPDFIPVD